MWREGWFNLECAWVVDVDPILIGCIDDIKNILFDDGDLAA